MRPRSLLISRIRLIASVAGLLTLTIAANLVPSEAEAAIRYVRSTDGVDTGPCTSDTSPCRTLAYGIFRANAGDTLYVAGEFAEAATISKNLILAGKRVGAGPIPPPWSSCSGSTGSSACPILRPPASASGLTIDSSAAVTIDDFNFFDASGAAAIRVESGSLLLRDSAVDDNTSSFAFGAGNGAGLAVEALGSADVRTCTFEGNSAVRGGAIHAAGALSVLDSTFTNNQTTIAGGALYVSGVSGWTVTNTSFVGNHTDGNGGGGAVSGGTGTLDGVSMSFNTIPGVTPGTTTLSPMALNVSGGADVTLRDSTIDNHSAAGGSEGVITIAFSQLSIETSTIANSSEFGVTVVASQLDVIDSTVRDHAEIGIVELDPSAIPSPSDIEITRSTISGSPGGIVSTTPSTISLVNSTIDTSATALFAKQATIDAHFSTIVGSSAVEAQSNAVVTFRDSVFSGTCVDIDSTSPTLLQDANVYDDSSCGPSPVVDVLLEPLAANGGPTETRHPMPDSRAINFGGQRCVPAPISGIDQRGDTRPVAGVCDVGAVEAPEPGFVVALFAGLATLASRRRTNH